MKEKKKGITKKHGNNYNYKEKNRGKARATFF